jgi:hypothetical protein
VAEPSENSSPNMSLSNTPLLNLLHESIKEYLKDEKLLHYMLYPNNETEVESLILITHDELIKMDRALLPLMSTLINKWYPAYQEFPRNLQACL